MGELEKNEFFISIITVVYNGVATLEQAMLSVINQPYKNIEYIIIDGGSTDGTVDIIKKHEDKLAYWISEPDNGIYDAMNKGVLASKHNSYILFLGADDFIYSPLPLNQLEKLMQENVTAVFFDVMQVDANSNKNKYYKCWLPKRISEKNFLKFPVHHQGCLIKRDWFINNPINVNIGIHADYKQMIDVINSKKTHYINDAWVAYRTNGASDFFTNSNLKSLRQISRELRFSWYTTLFLHPIVGLKMLTKILLGKKAISFFRRLK